MIVTPNPFHSQLHDIPPVKVAAKKQLSPEKGRRKKGRQRAQNNNTHSEASEIEIPHIGKLRADLLTFFDRMARESFLRNFFNSEQIQDIREAFDHYHQLSGSPEKLRQRRIELLTQKEHWKGRLESFKTEENRELYALLEKDFAEGQLIPIQSGAGGAYFLTNKEGEYSFVVKPEDEGIFCMNNRKGFDSLSRIDSEVVREGIPLYHATQTNLLVYQVAKELGIEEVVPETLFTCLSSQDFFDRIDRFDALTRIASIERSGYPDKEKITVVQRFVPHSSDLSEWIEEHTMQTSLLTQIDPLDVEKSSILMWVIGETDGHAGNLRIYIKGRTPSGEPTYGLKKVDNDLAFPQVNRGLLNMLVFLPHGELPLSERGKEYLEKIPVASIIAKMKNLEMDAAIPAFLERVECLQSLIKQKGITLKEIDEALHHLGEETR